MKWWLLLSALALGGCGHTIGDPTFGELALLAEGEGLLLQHGLMDSTALVDLGLAQVGRPLRRSLAFRNVGAGPLDLQSLSLEGPQAGLFTVPFAPGRLASGEAQAFEVLFEAPLDERLAQAEVSVHVTYDVLAGKTRSEVRTSSFLLRAHPATVDCEYLPVIDFGAVKLGETEVSSFDFRNTGGWSNTVVVEAPSGDGFSLATDSAPGSHTLSPGQSLRFNLVFTPRALGNAAGTVFVTPAQPCDLRAAVRLRGTGVDQLLVWSPTSVQLGPTAVGTVATAEVTFENLSFQPAPLSQLLVVEGTTPSPTCTVTDVNGAPVSEMLVPPATRDATSGDLVPGVAVLRVAFQPAAAGVRQATLRGVTSVPGQPTFAIPLRLEGTP